MVLNLNILILGIFPHFKFVTWFAKKRLTIKKKHLSASVVDALCPSNLSQCVTGDHNAMWLLAKI